MVSILLLAIILVVVLRGGWNKPPLKPPEVEISENDPQVEAVSKRLRENVLQQPGSADAWGRLGMFLLVNRNLEPASLCLNEAARLDPGEARWPYYQAIIASETDLAQSVVYLQRALERMDAPQVDTLLRLVDGLLLLGRTEEAERTLQEIVRLEPDNARAALGLARIEYGRNQWPQAESHLKKALDHPLTRKAAGRMYVEILQRRGDAEAASKLARRVAALPPDQTREDPLMAQLMALQVGREAQIQRATAMVSQGRLAEAIQLLSQTVRDYPRAAAAWMWLGRAWHRAGNLPEARQALEQAVRIDTEFTEAHYLLGLVLIDSGAPAEALGPLRRAIGLKPTHALASYQLGKCLLTQNERQQAEEAFRAAARAMPNFTEAHLELAELLQTSKPAEAREHLKIALQLEPDNARARALQAKLPS
ncbi:MAG: tetratricopeptide repeat protein [Gemmataceae bacterium]